MLFEVCCKQFYFEYCFANFSTSLIKDDVFHLRDFQMCWWLCSSNPSSLAGISQWQGAWCFFPYLSVSWTSLLVNSIQIFNYIFLISWRHMSVLNFYNLAFIFIRYCLSLWCIFHLLRESKNCLFFYNIQLTNTFKNTFWGTYSELFLLKNEGDLNMLLWHLKKILIYFGG